MTKWLQKYGHRMHIICVVFRNNNKKLVKKTYILVIVKAPQDVGAVITDKGWSRKRLPCP